MKEESSQSSAKRNCRGRPKADTMDAEFLTKWLTESLPGMYTLLDNSKGGFPVHCHTCDAKFLACRSTSAYKVIHHETTSAWHKRCVELGGHAIKEEDPKVDCCGYYIDRDYDASLALCKATYPSKGVAWVATHKTRPISLYFVDAAHLCCSALLRISTSIHFCSARSQMPAPSDWGT